MSNFFETVKSQTQAEREYLLAAPIITRVFNGQVSITEYASFLAQAYHHVKHTVPLLMAVGAKLSIEQEWIREAVAEYIEEEIREGCKKYLPNLDINSIKVMSSEDDSDPVTTVDEEDDERLFRLADESTKPYTAKVKIDYTVNNGAFSSSDFIIINI